jgi:hypothetical protein
MKRSAATADFLMPAAAAGASGRATRSTARMAGLEQQRLEEEVELEKARLQRAKDLTATSLLQALPLVLVSGFLYKHEIRSAVLACKSWKLIWVEAQSELPEHCLVEICLRGERVWWPLWLQAQRLQNVIHKHDFSRTIFNKLCDLKVAAENTERKKQKVRDALPKWGIDFLAIDMLVWSANNHNDGGIYFTLNPNGKSHNKLHGWSVRIDDSLRLWTWDGYHKWRKVYDGKPLWSALSDHD